MLGPFAILLNRGNHEDMLGISPRIEIMAEAVLGRWGKNLALRLPVNVARAARLEIGERVEVEIRDSEIVIRRRVPRFSAAQLFKGKSAKYWRAAYADSFDWGEDVGREVVQE